MITPKTYLDDLAYITSRTDNIAFEQSSVQTRTASYDTNLQEPVAYYYKVVGILLDIVFLLEGRMLRLMKLKINVNVKVF